MLSLALLLCILGNLASGFSSPSPFLTTIRPLNHPWLPSNANTTPQKSTFKRMGDKISVRGGGISSAATVDSSDEEGKCPMRKLANVLASFWAAGGVAMVLMNSVRRIAPIALEPLKATASSSVGEGAVAATTAVPLTNFQLGVYIITCLYFAYVEGYKGFQLKFSPLVVARSRTLELSWSRLHHILLGPFYAMGLFHATKRRMIVSWSVTLGVAAIVVLVKRLPYPWKNIVDAGVVVGLTWGTASIIVGYVKALFSGKSPEGVSPDLPVKEE